MGIASFTAASGCGKTTIINELLKSYPLYFNILPSYTTRKREDRDLEGEYVYLSKEEFSQKDQKKEFIWTANPHADLFYGTKFSSLENAFKSEKYYLMSVVPHVMHILDQYAQEKNSILIPFYIKTPDENILRERLLIRGDSEKNIDSRIQDCKKWEKIALESGVPYKFIENNGPIKDTVSNVIKILNQYSSSFVSLS